MMQQNLKGLLYELRPINENIAFLEKLPFLETKKQPNDPLPELILKNNEIFLTYLDALLVRCVYDK